MLFNSFTHLIQTEISRKGLDPGIATWGEIVKAASAASAAEVLVKLVQKNEQNVVGTRTSAAAAFQWSLSAYCILLAPWSAVRIRTHSLNPDSAREMAIHAKHEIAQGECVYELAGQLAADAASKSKHTDLSTMRSCDRTKRILFGPIRWVNHHCDANTQVLAWFDRASAIST
ncbi:hypothetical protein B0H14DRAFT_3458263 [Mycena olivaceomarginata]|nr:hypothetical protein B0H14DRAFT_3458263 [Mycena olivaceomarginata]